MLFARRATVRFGALAVLALAALAAAAGPWLRQDAAGQPDPSCLLAYPTIDGLIVHRQVVNPATHNSLHHESLGSTATIALSTNVSQIELNGSFCAYGNEDFGIAGVEVLWDGVPMNEFFQPSASSIIRLFPAANTSAQWIGDTPRTVQISVRRIGMPGTGTGTPLTIHRPSADVNCLNGVTGDDVIRVLLSLAGVTPLPPAGPNCGSLDVDYSGTVDVGDALHIRNLLAGNAQPYKSTATGGGK